MNESEVIADFLSGMSIEAIRKKHHHGYVRIRRVLVGAGLDPSTHRQIVRQQRMGPVTDTEIAWLAGLLEGEGYFGMDERASSPYPMIQLNMADEDVVRRAAAIMVNICGTTSTVTEKKVYTGETGVTPKQQWRVGVTSSPAIQILRAILPYMGSRRSERIIDLIKKGEKNESRCVSNGN